MLGQIPTAPSGGAARGGTFYSQAGHNAMELLALFEPRAGVPGLLQMVLPKPERTAHGGIDSEQSFAPDASADGLSRQERAHSRCREKNLRPSGYIFVTSCSHGRTDNRATIR